MPKMKGLAAQKRHQPTKRLSFGEKAEVLKRYEVYSYQIAHYLLQREDAARRAAENTLLSLYQSDDFFMEAEADKADRVKKETIRHALRVRQAAAGATG
ncbi:hypothetical protein, partial [Paenibacillus validus]|uniref:hypothetical protein n=1 Tax=Paenibacillus validus TaxID=44253 RepID=UPI00399C875E